VTGRVYTLGRHRITGAANCGKGIINMARTIRKGEMSKTSTRQYDIKPIEARAHSLGLRLDRYRYPRGQTVYRAWEFASGAPVGQYCTAKVMPRVLDDWEREGRSSREWPWMLNPGAYRFHGWRARTSPLTVQKERRAREEQAWRHAAA